MNLSGRVVIGAWFGAILAVAALVLGLVRALFFGHGAEGAIISVANLNWAALYVLGFLGAGVLAGILAPLGKRSAGAAVVGLISFIPIGVSWICADYMHAPETPLDVISVVITGLILGPVTAVGIFRGEGTGGH